MNNVRFQWIWASFLVCAACETPRNSPKQDPEPPQLSVAPSESEQKPKEPDPEPPQLSVAPSESEQKPKEPANRLRVVDGRAAIPSSQATPVGRIVVYSYGLAPDPIVPEPGSITIQPLPLENTGLTVAQGYSISSVTLRPSRRDWEPVLMSKGISVLDRESLPALEFEHFIQRASARTLEVDRILKRAVVGQDQGEYFSFNSQLVGRDDYGAPGLRWWSILGDLARPLLNGANLSAERALAEGKVQSSKGLLEIGDFTHTETFVSLDCTQPRLPLVRYVPELDESSTLPALMTSASPESGVWKQDESDPFHLSFEGGRVYFDPSSKSLWRVGDAWVGTTVTRTDYIARRTRTETVTCGECGQVNRDESKTIGPEAKTVPTQWECSRCMNTGKVKYLDGYRPHMSPEADSAMTIGAAWVKPEPGLYPVLRAGPNPGFPSSYSMPIKSGMTYVQCAQAMTKDLLAALGSDDLKWCMIKEDGSALVFTPLELDLLRVALGLERKDSLRPPKVNATGRQMFRLEHESHQPSLIKIPVVTAAVSIRLVNVETSEVLVSGVIELDYRNLLGAPRSFAVGLDGPALESWPSREVQLAQLQAAIKRRVVGTMKP